MVHEGSKREAATCMQAHEAFSLSLCPLVRRSMHEGLLVDVLSCHLSLSRDNSKKAKGKRFSRLFFYVSRSRDEQWSLELKLRRKGNRKDASPD